MHWAVAGKSEEPGNGAFTAYGMPDEQEQDYARGFRIDVIAAVAG